MAFNWKTNTSYNFSVFPTIITTVFNNVLVTGVMSYELASQFGDLESMHQAYYAYLPDGTPDDPTLFDYITVKLPSGERTVLATAWIKENTIQQRNAAALRIVMDNVNVADIPRLRDVLTTNGFTNYTIQRL